MAFMSPFKVYYAQEIAIWIRQHPGQTIENPVKRLFSVPASLSQQLQSEKPKKRKPDDGSSDSDEYSLHDSSSEIASAT
ncbi:hypothetical protein ILUMI_00760 [Ignelater luminosus]|uniref:Uncharacterized protein n=1 Tax=Ignelater luminosus TaxID=2038154 RepID=A0A8K0DL97_IGNLU|nr:hypothetical protein ILUMI_00760 [Ignelater luminosus]